MVHIHDLDYWPSFIYISRTLAAFEVERDYSNRIISTNMKVWIYFSQNKFGVNIQYKPKQINMQILQLQENGKSASRRIDVI
jgi:hypothetical protein